MEKDNENINEKSNKKKKGKKPKKEKTMKQIIISRIIFVILFLAIVAGVTYYFINFENNKENSENENIIGAIQNAIENNYETVDLDGSYYTNPIKITEKQEDMDKVSEGFKYFEIDGLKNETIEEKINAYIKDNFKSYIEDIIEKSDNDATYIMYLDVVGNFANIISLSMNITEEFNSDDIAPNYYIHFCNVNLVDGEEINLGTDVFESESVASNFLLDMLYNQVAQMYTEMNEETWELYPSEESKNIEEYIYEIVSNYQRGKGFEFGISPSSLLCVTNVYYTATQQLYFLDYAKKLIIYDRFSSNKELYDGKYKKIGPFYNLTNEENCIDKTIEQTDKYYINTSIQSYTDEDLNTAILNVIKNLRNEEIDNKKELANEYTYLVGNIEVDVMERYVNGGYDGYNVNITEYYVNTSKNNFENQILPECLKYMRTRQDGEGGGLGGGIWLFATVDYAESDFYYIEIDNEGNIISDTRKEDTQDSAEDPWLTVD